VLYAGSFQPRKRVDLIIRQAARLPGLRFRLAGKGETDKDCRDLAQQLGCSNLSFLGHLSAERLGEEMRQADIFFSPASSKGIRKSCCKPQLVDCQVSPWSCTGPIICRERQNRLLDPVRCRTFRPPRPTGRRCRLAPLLCQGCNSARRQFDWDKIAGQWAAVFERAWQKRRPCVQKKYLEHLPARGGATMKRTSALVRYGGFFLSVGTARVLGLLITSLTFPILVRRLGVETYGLWSYVVALCAFFDVVANPGLTTHIAQQVAARRHAAAELVTDFLALRSFEQPGCNDGAARGRPFRSSSRGAPLAPVVRCGRTLRWLDRNRLSVEFSGTISYSFGDEFDPAGFVWSRSSAAGALSERYPLAARKHPGIGAGNQPCGLGRAMEQRLSSIAEDQSRPMAGNHGPQSALRATTMMATVYHRIGHLVVHRFLGDYALGLYAAAVRFVDILKNFVTDSVERVMPRMALSAQSGAG